MDEIKIKRSEEDGQWLGWLMDDSLDVWVPLPYTPQATREQVIQGLHNTNPELTVI